MAGSGSDLHACREHKEDTCQEKSAWVLGLEADPGAWGLCLEAWGLRQRAVSRWHAAWIEIPCMTQARVLVADDQADIQQALRLLLSDAGYDTDLVGSVEAVMDRLGAGGYD